METTPNNTRYDQPGTDYTPIAIVGRASERSIFFVLENGY